MLTLSILKGFVGSRAGQLCLVGITCLGVGAFIHKKLSPPTTTTIHDQVYVDRPVLTESIVDRIVTDPKQQEAIAILFKENNALKLKVTQLSSTVATNQTTGGTTQGGTITPEPDVNHPTVGTEPTVNPSVPEPSTQPIQPASFTYTDFQLAATYSSSKFVYQLNQTFIIESSTATGADGRKVGLTKLFQDTPTGLKPIPTKTVVVQADPDTTHWMVSPRVQGGLSIDQTRQKGGFIGLQLFKRGTSRDPKDLSLSVGTVGVVIDAGGSHPLLLPVSLNLGHLPKQPFSNVWLSPGVDRVGHFSVLLTATF